MHVCMHVCTHAARAPSLSLSLALALALSLSLSLAGLSTRMGFAGVLYAIVLAFFKVPTLTGLVRFMEKLLNF